MRAYPIQPPLTMFQFLPHFSRLRTIAPLVLFGALGAGSVMLFSGNSNGRASQANEGNTGAPGEGGNTCGFCHNGGGFGSVSGMLSVLDGSGSPVSAWEAGETYDLTLDISASNGTPSGYGFQLTALDASNNEVGSLAAGSSNTKTATASAVGGRTYAEHNGGASASPSFTVAWTAPAAGAGDVTFYFCGNAVNLNGASSADNAMPGSSLSLPEGGGTTAIGDPGFDPQLTLFPNPAPNGVLEVRGEWLALERPSVSLLDASGRVVRQYGQVDGAFHAELGSAASGVHYLRFQTAEGVHTETVQVVR